MRRRDASINDYRIEETSGGSIEKLRAGKTRLGLGQYENDRGEAVRRDGLPV